MLECNQVTYKNSTVTVKIHVFRDVNLYKLVFYEILL